MICHIGTIGRDNNTTPSRNVDLGGLEKGSSYEYNAIIPKIIIARDSCIQCGMIISLHHHILNRYTRLKRLDANKTIHIIGRVPTIKSSQYVIK